MFLRLDEILPARRAVTDMRLPTVAFPLCNLNCCYFLFCLQQLALILGNHYSVLGDKLKF